MAKTLPTLFIGVLAIFPSLLIVAMFNIPLRGSLRFFLAMTALFLLSAISLGVLVATVTRTLRQACASCPRTRPRGAEYFEEENCGCIRLRLAPR